MQLPEEPRVVHMVAILRQLLARFNILNSNVHSPTLLLASTSPSPHHQAYINIIPEEVGIEPKAPLEDYSSSITATSTTVATISSTSITARRQKVKNQIKTQYLGILSPFPMLVPLVTKTLLYIGMRVAGNFPLSPC
jgi:hypothetical protein